MEEETENKGISDCDLVLQKEVPGLSEDTEFNDLIKRCLRKEREARPNIDQVLEHAFI